MTDPDYARLLTKISCIAKVYGYAIGLHGSGTRDLDLLAVPWTEEAASADKLVLTICVECELFNPPDNPRIRPHGRLGWALHLSRQDRRYVDLSVMPLKADDARPSQDGLPELPSGHAPSSGPHAIVYTADEMLAYGAQCRAAAKEET